jgi:hypothetical protein
MSADGTLSSSRLAATARLRPSPRRRPSASSSVAPRNSSSCRSASQPKSRELSATPASTRTISGASRNASVHASISPRYSSMACPSAAVNAT